MSQVQWTSEMARSLVELYKLHPALYKVNSPNYHNKYESMQFLLPYCSKDKGASNLAVTYVTTTAEIHAEDDRVEKINTQDAENLIIELPDDIHENPSEANYSCSFDAEGVIDTNLPGVESQIFVASSGTGSTTQEIARRKEREAAKQSSNAADVDDCRKNAINAIVSENNTAPKTDVKAFCDFIESELSQIKN
ncbi:hypothetical protein ILUMI_20068 [Ignelater luminosus]|uniref:Uncharacterized protein n=1 Tax=Ignelater luminosus TaxID=2038154 RepID=A0A8K0CLN3_IGNLU|nr:hypothetical protein ILUMI_20068 [Ignelater luminosus]